MSSAPWRKICPTCATDNDPGDLMCARCLGDISAVAPTAASTAVPAPAPPPPAASPLPAPAAPGPAAARGAQTLALVFPDGGELALPAGAVVGREAEGAARFAAIEQISRRHARFTATPAGFAVEDLGSTNGTWLDGVRLAPGAVSPLRAGAELRLSSRIVCTVRIS